MGPGLSITGWDVGTVVSPDSGIDVGDKVVDGEVLEGDGDIVDDVDDNFTLAKGNTVSEF